METETEAFPARLRTLPVGLEHPLAQRPVDAGPAVRDPDDQCVPPVTFVALRSDFEHDLAGPRELDGVTQQVVQ